MGNIGFIGVGKMGSRMARRLMDAGHDMTVWNRRDEFYDQNIGLLQSLGAKVADSPVQCAMGRDLIFTSLFDGHALKTVCTGDGGILQANPAPGIIVDMGTVSPQESEEVAKAADSAGVSFLRCSVSGSTGQAETGTLTLMASGDRAAYDAADSYLACLGERRFFVGPGENARFLKLIVNMNLGAQMMMLAESVVVGEKAGLDWQQMLDVMEASVACSPFVKYKIPLLAKRDYAPMATLGLAHKDRALAVEAARSVNAEIPLLETIVSLEEEAIADGLGARDMAAVVLWYEKVAGLKPKLSH